MATAYFHWGPRDAYSLTMPELLRWNAAAVRIEQERAAAAARGR